ncbi:MAG: prepilin-type N-terminal cleavage/methylation domain-containing protein [Verrucomicrobia bacterium]|jgi:prepilin-type N-terminal cleavage/methylation domain-containing protein|nr:prepilin-type N-terminal cleavage/methylation domain-containing protein [Verrucomicrobiota bacterium]
MRSQVTRIGDRTASAGFTLIEVLVAAVLLVMGLSTFLMAFSSVRRVSVSADRRMASMHRAREILESVMDESYGDSALNVGSHTLPDATYQVSLCDDFTTTKDIAVTVPWVDPRGNVSRDLTIWGSMASCIH